MVRENNGSGMNSGSAGKGSKFGPGNRSNSSRGSSNGGRFGGNSRSGPGNGRSFSDRPRESHKAICADCGTECDVPFKPSGERPVYCRDCFAKHKPAPFR